MGKYKFYIFKAKIVVILLTILSLGLFALYYIPKQGAGMVAFVPVSLLLFFAMNDFSNSLIFTFEFAITLILSLSFTLQK